MYIYGDTADVEDKHHQMGKEIGANLVAVMYDVTAIKKDIESFDDIDDFNNNSKLALADTVVGLYVSGRL
jgi:hypothetical protein